MSYFHQNLYSFTLIGLNCNLKNFSVISFANPRKTQIFCLILPKIFSMKKLCIALITVLALASCSSKEQTKDLTLTGTIKGLKSGTVYIQKYQDTSLVVIDSIKIDGNSSFESHLDLKEPEMLYIVLDRGVTTTIDNSLLVFAEAGKIDVQTDLQHFYASSKITGSKNHDLYVDYQKMSSKYKDQLHDLLQLDMNNFKEGKATNTPEIIEKRNLVLKKKYLAAINFAINHKEYEVAPFIALSEISDANIKYLDTINKSLTPKVASSKYGKMLGDFIEMRKEDEATAKK